MGSPNLGSRVVRRPLSVCKNEVPAESDALDFGRIIREAVSSNRELAPIIGLTHNEVEEKLLSDLA